jgi:hypothetical protein
MKLGFGHMKKCCAGCQRRGVPMNKEHVFPKWLVLRTGTDKTSISWGPNNRASALAATLPLCTQCNKDFGDQLEGPTSRLFDDIEQGRGLSDEDAELLVRWMWKVAGLFWIALNPGVPYTRIRNLRDRVLLPIDDLRGRLILAVALIAGRNMKSTDWPMGIDSDTVYDAVFVSGVFSKIAMMVVLEPFAHLIPPQFGKYHLAPKRDPLHAGKLFYPPMTFKDDVEAVGITAFASGPLSEAHDELAVAVAQDRAEQEPRS